MIKRTYISLILLAMSTPAYAGGIGSIFLGPVLILFIITSAISIMRAIAHPGTTKQIASLVTITIVASFIISAILSEASFIGIASIPFVPLLVYEFAELLIFDIDENKKT